jgi:hypothetical protein
VLILTKPLGIGIITTAAKQDSDRLGAIQEAIEVMATLNRAACEAMIEVGVHAATDVTGSGLLGHLRNLVAASKCAARIRFEDVPTLDAAVRYVKEGIAPGGTHANWRFLGERRADLGRVAHRGRREKGGSSRGRAPKPGSALHRRHRTSRRRPRPNPRFGALITRGARLERGSSPA